MIGILFLIFLAGYFWAATRLTRIFVRFVSSKWRPIPSPLVFVVVCALPVGDEIVGGIQFASLCREKAVLKVDAEKIKGRRVVVKTDPSNKYLEGTAVRIRYSLSKYYDAETGEELASYGILDANGGWLFRVLTGQRGLNPLFFPSSCTGGDLNNYDFTLVNQ